MAMAITPPTTCPPGYNHSVGGACVMVTDGATSLAECIDLCGASGAPLCLDTTAALAAATLVEVLPLSQYIMEMPTAAWIGNHQSAAGTACLDGTTALEPNPTLSVGPYRDCALLNEGVITPTLCNYHSFQLYRCLCAADSGSSSPAASAILDNWAAADTARRVRILMNWILISLLLALLPPLVSCVRGVARRMRASGIGSNVAGSTATIMKAREQAEQLRGRMNRWLFWLGWFVLWLSCLPSISVVFHGNDVPGTIAPLIGPWCAYWLLMPPSIALAILSVTPTNAGGVRNVCAFFFGFCSFLFVMSLFSAVRGLPDVLQFIIWCPKTDFFTLPYLLPTLRCDCCDPARAMPPRAALRRLWFGLRLTFFSMGVWMVGVPSTFAAINGGVFFGRAPNLNSINELFRMGTGLSFLAVGLAVSPRNRGGFLVWLSDVTGGEAANQQQEAAAIAAIVGKGDATKLLEEAAALFRALPFESLHAADLLSNKPATKPARCSSNATPEQQPDSIAPLHERTVKLSLGECQSFFSHSWSDDGAQKYASLSSWAAEYAAAHGGRQPMMWLDKACIDQQKIEASLSCLPIYLAGCQTFLIVAGPTYTSRLWCLLECFTYIKMGGDRSQVQMRALEGEDVERALANTDASKANCFIDRDRQHLLAIIETGFGDASRFNRVLRDIFASKSGGSTGSGTTGGGGGRGSKRGGSKYKVAPIETA